ncbi:unnamed protein product [Knipowitschia caucasica]|uniref:Uncharacterized protein n=1 Tax=Knipowitschia caucasica TaxID=637954 RepID=A0AAV2IQV1_KNICA
MLHGAGKQHTHSSRSFRSNLTSTHYAALPDQESPSSVAAVTSSRPRTFFFDISQCSEGTQTDVLMNQYSLAEAMSDK